MFKSGINCIVGISELVCMFGSLVKVPKTIVIGELPTYNVLQSWKFIGMNVQPLFGNIELLWTICSLNNQCRQL